MAKMPHDEAFAIILTTMHDNMRNSASQHFLAAERFRTWAWVTEYVSAGLTLLATGAGVSAFAMRKAGTATRLTLDASWGVAAAIAPITFAPSLFHYHPRTLYERHMQAALDLQELQKKVECTRQLMEDPTDRAFSYAYLEMLVHAKKRADATEKVWDCDWETVKERRVKKLV